MYTFVIVTMRLCGQRNTSQKYVNEAARWHKQTHTSRPRRTRKGNHVQMYIDEHKTLSCQVVNSISELFKTGYPGAKTIKKNTNSTQNKYQTHNARAYEVTSFLSTDCELSTETWSRFVYSLGPWLVINQNEVRRKLTIWIFSSSCPDSKLEFLFHKNRCRWNNPHQQF